MMQMVSFMLLWKCIVLLAAIPPENYYNQGNYYYLAGKYQQAEEAYTKAFSGKAVVQKAYYNAGNAAYLQGKYYKAIAYYEQALDLDSEDEDAWYNLELARRKAAGQKKRLAPKEIYHPCNLRQGLSVRTSRNSGRKERKQDSPTFSSLQNLSEDNVDQILARAREQEQRLQHFSSSRFSQKKPLTRHRDIFTQSPEEILQTMRELTRAAYPFRPGSSLQKPKPIHDEVDW